MVPIPIPQTGTRIGRNVVPIAGIVVVVGVLAFMLTGYLLYGGSRAHFPRFWTSFSSEQFKDPEREKQFNAYVTSKGFLVRILNRKEKYGDISAEALKCWNPVVVNRTFIVNERNEISLDRKYQGVLYELRDDVYEELSVALKEYGWGR